MSNDIFYTNLSNLVTFYMGERPSADKFNAVNKYFSRGMRELATAIGDVNDDGFPYIGTAGPLGPSWNVGEAGEKKRLLDIVSLARIIGPASNLNSRIHLNSSQTTQSIEELIPKGALKYQLLYPANVAELNPSIPGYYFDDEASQPFYTPARFKILNERELIFSSPLSEDKTVLYFTQPNKYYGGVDYENAGFNVIPDPNQNNGVQITATGDRKYEISFPIITNQQSGLSNLKSSDISTNNEFNNAKHYELPKWLIASITDSDGAIIEENRVIPGNFLYLKNRRTQEVYKDAVYEYESPTSLIVSNIDLCTEENGVDYSSTDYCIILTGTNITNTLDDLRLKWFKHSHDGTFGESPIQFKSLVGKFTETPPSGIYGPSSNEWNQMPMYLHRDGYQTDNNLNNGMNGMRGPLLMGVVTFDPLNASVMPILNDTVNDDTHAILFGSNSVYIKRSGLDLLLKQDLYADIIVEGNKDINILGAENILLESPRITSNCENFTVNSSFRTLMNSENLYVENTGTANIQVYPLKTENGSLVKAKMELQQDIQYGGVTYSGYPDKRTSIHNINQILKMTTYETALFEFAPKVTSGTYPKKVQSDRGTLRTQVSDIYQPEFNNSDYKEILIYNGLRAIADVVALGEDGIFFDDPREVARTPYGAAIYNNEYSIAQLGADFWNTDYNGVPTDNKVYMRIPNSSNFFGPTVELEFIQPKLRVMYKIVPWNGHYRTESTDFPGEFIGSEHGEDHYIFDLNFMRPKTHQSSEARLRYIEWRFNRWLPWNLEVFGSNWRNEESVFSETHIEYESSFIIDILTYPYAAYSGLEGPDTSNWRYVLDYQGLFYQQDSIVRKGDLLELIVHLDQPAVESTGLQAFEIEVTSPGIVELRANVSPDNNGRHNNSWRFVKVIERIIDRKLILNIQLMDYHVGSDVSVAGLLESAHERFIERTVAANV